MGPTAMRSHSLRTRAALGAAFLLTLSVDAGAERFRPGGPAVERRAATDAPLQRPRHATRAPRGDLQQAIYAARDAVLPALVHVEPIVDVYQRGQKAKAALTGSGVIVSPQGHVLTNDHVVANARRVQVVLTDRREVAARVLGRDTFTDVAVLLLDPVGAPYPAAEIGSSATIQAGQHVIALGSPLGLARSISVGVVSTPDRYFPEDFLPSGEITGTYNTWIQTDAAINPGNSGGPLIDLSGRVIGINARAVPIFGENLGFAIPVDVVREVATELIEDGRVERSWIGVRWQHLKTLADYFGAAGRGGVLVGGVIADSPAARAGLVPGDVVVDWDGEPVAVRFEEELPVFRKRVADTGAGRDVPVLVLRNGVEHPLVVTTEVRPSTESEQVELHAWGLTGQDVTPEIARQRRLDDLRGVLVTGVRPAGPAATAGLRQGDVIRLVEGRRIASTVDLLERYRELREERVELVLVKADRGTSLRVAAIAPDLP